MFGKELTEQQKLTKQLIKKCRDGNHEEVKKLIDAGADVNAEDQEGWSPVFVAAVWGSQDKQVKILELLHEKGADLNVKTSHYLSMGSYGGVSRGLTPLLAAIDEYHLEIAMKLIEAGADVKEKSSSGWTALHYAAYRGYFHLAKALVEHGADINALDDRGNKPESLAKQNEQFGVADFLRDLADANAAAVAAKKPAKLAKPGWMLTGEEEVSCVSEKKEIGYRLTDIFNFETRMFTRIAYNTKAEVESQTVRFFDEITDKKILENAHKKLVELGGTADKNAIYSASLDKKQSVPGL